MVADILRLLKVECLAPLFLSVSLALRPLPDEGLYFLPNAVVLLYFLDDNLNSFLDNSSLFFLDGFLNTFYDFCRFGSLLVSVCHSLKIFNNNLRSSIRIMIRGIKQKANK